MNQLLDQVNEHSFDSLDIEIFLLNVEMLP